MTEDLIQFHHVNKAGVPVAVFDYRIFEYLKDRENILICGGVPFVYRDGVYHPDSGAELKTMIRKLIVPELIRSTTIERIYRLFLSDAELQVSTEELNQYPDHWINFRNGFYDPKTGVMYPHSPTYKAVNQLPHDFDPARCPAGETVDEWLRFITPEEDDREMLLQYCGYCMTKDIKQQKFLILCGSGGSGKSTLIGMLENVIGSDNISNVSLKELSQRFASYGLMGKLLNSCADLEISALEDPSIVKKLLGEDRIRIEAKGKDAVSMKSYARMIFSTNELPLILSEKTNGFYRRLMILRMDRKPEKKQADYLSCLKKESDHFIHLCVQALQRMYEKGLICESAGSVEAVQMLRNDSDTVEAWINDEMFRDPNARIERGFLYEKYERYCERSDRKKLSRNNFYRSLRLKDFREGKTNGSRYFEGLSPEQNCPKCPEIENDEEKPF